MCDVVDSFVLVPTPRSSSPYPPSLAAGHAKRSRRSAAIRLSSRFQISFYDTRVTSVNLNLETQCVTEHGTTTVEASLVARSQCVGR